MATHSELRKANAEQPQWTIYLFKGIFGVYMLVSVVVLINLLIAMMSDTYQRIQVIHSLRRVDQNKKRY